MLIKYLNDLAKFKLVNNSLPKFYYILNRVKSPLIHVCYLYFSLRDENLILINLKFNKH